MSQSYRIIIVLFLIFNLITLKSQNKVIDLYDYEEIIDVSNIILDSNNLLIYDKIQNDIIKFNYITRKITFLKIEQLIANYIKKENISQSRIHSMKMINSIPYCIFTVTYLEDSLFNYNCFLINLYNYEIELVTSNSNFIIYGVDFDKICDYSFILQTYTNNYHHSQHGTQKDSVSFISTYSNNKLEKLFSMGDLEEYTSSKLAYVFDLNFYEFDKNMIIMMKQLDLFISVSFDCSNFQNKNISKIERNRFLTEFFEQSKVNEPFKAYDKYIHQKNNKFEFLNFFQNNNNLYLVFYEKNESIYNFTIIKYNKQLKIVSTKTLELQTILSNPNSVFKLENNTSKDLIVIKNQNDEFEIIELNFH